MSEMRVVEVADVNTWSVCSENQSGELQRRRELTSFLTSHSSAGPDAARGDPEEHEEERGLAWDGVGDEEEDAEVEEKKKEEEEGWTVAGLSYVLGGTSGGGSEEAQSGLLVLPLPPPTSPPPGHRGSWWEGWRIGELNG